MLLHQLDDHILHDGPRVAVRIAMFGVLLLRTFPARLGIENVVLLFVVGDVGPARVHGGVIVDVLGLLTQQRLRRMDGRSVKKS